MHCTLHLTEYYFCSGVSLTEDQGPLLPVQSPTPRPCTRHPPPAAEYSESRKYQTLILKLHTEYMYCIKKHICSFTYDLKLEKQTN